MWFRRALPIALRLASSPLASERASPFSFSILRHIRATRKEKSSAVVSPVGAVDKEANKHTWEEIIDEAVGEDKTEKYRFRYGHDEQDAINDRVLYELFVASAVGVLFVGAFLLHNAPDLKQRDWSVREAYLELTRREANGLSLIDRNLINPARIHLPSDEELADFEVII